MQFGQPLFGAAQFSPGQIDLLASSAANTGAASTTLNVIAANPYSALLIHVHNPGGATIADALWAKVVGPLAALATFSGAFPSQPTVAAIGLADIQTIIGCANNIGDSLAVTVAFAAAPPAGTTISVYGLTVGSLSRAMRSDGRNFPEGAFPANSSEGGSGTSNIIAAPGAANRILLKLIGCNDSNAASTIQIQGTLTGIVGNLMSVRGLGSLIQTFETGLLLDPNTALTIVSVGGVGDAFAVYDLVPA